MIEQGYTQSKAARSLGVDPASIRSWIRLYASVVNGSTTCLTDSDAFKAENHRLREENRRFPLEREIFKKAMVFCAKDQP